MKEVAMVCALILTVSTQAASGQSSSGNAVPVTVDNFIRAESDLYFSEVVLKERARFGKFKHRRELSPIDNRRSSGSTATHFIRRRCSILMRGR